MSVGVTAIDLDAEPVNSLRQGLALYSQGMINSKYFDEIKKFEGFAERSQWDYAQHTNGYGTRARFKGETIDRTEAENRFQTEIAQAAGIVERHAPGLDEGSKAALTSLTFNAGAAWTQSGLGAAVARGDLEAARQIFKLYDKAGGQQLPGLVQRRAVEAGWFGSATSHHIGQTTAAEPPVRSKLVPAQTTSLEILKNMSLDCLEPAPAAVAKSVGGRDVFHSEATQHAAHHRLATALALWSFARMLAADRMQDQNRQDYEQTSQPSAARS